MNPAARPREGAEETHAKESARTANRARQTKPRLLFLSQTLPYPPDIGVNIRTYNVLRLLARQFEITALCFYRKAERPRSGDVEESLSALRQLGRVEAFAIPQEHSRTRWIVDHLRSVTSGRGYTHYAYASKAFGQRVRALLTTEHFDLVHIDSLDLVGYVPHLTGLPVICTHHNVESLLLARRAEAAGNSITRWYIRKQSRWTAADEQLWCPRFEANVVVSEDDGAALQRIAPTSRIIVVPNGVDTGLFQPQVGGDTGVVFVGGYNWLPNREAMQYFAQRVMPHLRRRGIDAAVTWVGRAPEQIKHEYDKRYGIQLTGYVDDIRPIVDRAACYVVPLQTGGGTRLKILDAWAMGKAVVSTSIGCEGLEAIDGKNILIRDDPASFAEAVGEVLSNEALRRRIGAAARETAERLYDWEVLGRIIDREYLSHVSEWKEHRANA